jgi:predicted Zn-dependent protease
LTTHQLVVPVVATRLTGFATAGPACTERADCPTEQTVARAAAARIEREWPLRSTDAVTDFVRQVGRRLAEHVPDSPYPWTFTVVRDRSANAFAIGGGAIYVHDGTIAVARNEAEVAAVLAHEMGHQLAGHFCVGRQEDASWSRLLADLIGGGVPPEHGVGSMSQTVDPVREREADRLSIPILESAGYDPRAALDIARRAACEGSDERRRTDDLARLLKDVAPGGAPDLDRRAFEVARRQVLSEAADRRGS